jgi:hypothetical protein
MFRLLDGLALPEVVTGPKMRLAARPRKVRAGRLQTLARTIQ